MLGNVLLVLESAVVDQDDDGTRPLPPPPPVSIIVGIVVLLLRLKDPRRKDRDKALESGRNMEDVLVDVSAGSAACLVSNSCVTNLSSKTKSASDDFELRLDNPLDPLLMVLPFGFVDDIGNTSESYNKENPKRQK